MENIKSDLDKQKALLNVIGKEKHGLQTKYDSLNTQLRGVQQEMGRLRKGHADLEREASESRRLLEARISEDTKQGQGRKLIENQLKELKLKVESLNAEQEKLKGEVEAKQVLIDRLQHEKQSLAEDKLKLTRLEDERTSLLKELEIEKAKVAEVKKLKMELGMLELQLKKAEQLRDSLTSSVSTLEGKFAVARDEAVSLEKQLSTARAEKDTIAAKIPQLKRSLEQEAHQKEERNLAAAKLAKELESFRHRISELELGKEKLTNDLDQKTIQLEKMRSSLASEVEVRVAKVIEQNEILEASEKQLKKEFEALSVVHATTELHVDKLSREIEDLNHEVSREQKAALSAERMRNSLKEHVDSLKATSEKERRSRSESEVMMRKLTTTLESTKRELQERTHQLITLQKVLNPHGKAENLSKEIPQFVDLTKRLEESERFRKKAEESKALLQAQLDDARKRWSEELTEKDSQYFAHRRSLLNDLAGISSNRSSPQKRPLSTSFINSEAHRFDLELRNPQSSERGLIENKENLEVDGKSKEDLKDMCRSLQSSKTDLLGVYHETSQNLVKIKEQLADALQEKSQLEHELYSRQLDRSEENTAQMSDLNIHLEAEIARNEELTDTIRLYKSRAEEYYSRLESAETIVLKATRAEEFAKAQCTEAEDSLAVAIKERKQSEKAVVDLQAKFHALEGELEDKNIDLAHSKQLQQRLAKELEDLNSRWSSEITISQSSLEAMRDRYSDEIRSLSSNLETEKLRSSELQSDRRRLEGQVETLMQRSHNSEEQTRLEKQVAELSKTNEDSVLAYQDAQKRIGSLLSQVRTLRTTMNEMTADRDQLQKDKRVLEQRFTEISRNFEELATSSGSPQDPTKGVEELRSVLKQQAKTSTAVLEQLQYAKEQLDANKLVIEHERKRYEELEAKQTAYEMEKKELQLKLLGLETRLLGPQADDAKFLRQKVGELETQLEAQSRQYTDDLRQSRLNDRSVRDLYTQINQKDKQFERLQEEAIKSEDKIKRLKESLESLQAEDASHRLVARRSEREARDAKERALLLEKELLEWKSRFESISSNRLSRSDIGSRSFA
jgi:myosin protein heavy chain